MLKRMKEYCEINTSNVCSVTDKLENELVKRNRLLFNLKNHAYVTDESCTALLRTYSDNIRTMQIVLGYEIFGCLLSDIYDDEDKLYRDDKDFEVRKKIYDNIIDETLKKSFDFEHYKDLF